jgi:hypothetical protein
MRELRQAICDRLATVATDRDITYYPFEPDEVDAPAICVLPDDPFVDYHQAQGHSQSAEWRFVLTLFVNRVDEDSAQQLLDEWVDPAGVFVTALQSDDYYDRLFELSHNYVTAVSGGRYGGFVQGNTSYLVAQMRVSIKA